MAERGLGLHGDGFLWYNKASISGPHADKLTGVYKPHEYGEVILPMTVIDALTKSLPQPSRLC
jgi:hypothetical protein